ncbi:hypothetical protein [Methylacidimicrobium sp. AP8]|uniref:hypothetical protein n=1 Tax=Methylacidimicrobium sp. AP8 TaxID=2730359 RepID=UPI0019219AA9|nr:hypothetical protein [Methylacidimicrobium sp. AP8]
MESVPQNGATAAACNACPPAPAPANQAAPQAAGGASSATQAPPENKSNEPADADLPNVKKAPWFTEKDLRNPESELAAQLAVQYGITPNPSSQSGSNTPAASAHVAKPMSVANARIVQTLDKELNLQYNGFDPETQGLCFTDWNSTLADSSIDLGRGIFLANFPSLDNAAKLDQTRISPMGQAMLDGDLHRLNPYFVEVPEIETMSGDTFIIPASSAIDPSNPPSITSWHRVPKYVAGHIGFVKFDTATNDWVAVSTNVDGSPLWNVMPLSEMHTHGPMRFFHWNGPVPYPPKP